MKITPAPAKKKVMVIGGGLAGMEAARVAALRGHSVALYEQGTELGGQLQTAAHAPGRQDMAEPVRYYRHQFELLNVDVHLGTEVTPEMVEREAADAVIVATGGVAARGSFPGSDNPNVALARDVLSGKAEVGKKVPFRPVHIVEYLQKYLEGHKDELRPLNLRVAYQRPCASRLSPGKEPAIDSIFEMIGVERVERRYDSENALCCSGAIAQWDGERAAALRARNLDDAETAGAQAMCYLCPMCRRLLSPDAESKGLANYHIIDLVRMSLGELPRP
jgi:hypothetical protein